MAWVATAVPFPTSPPRCCTADAQTWGLLFGFRTAGHYRSAWKSLFGWGTAHKHSQLQMGSVGFPLTVLTVGSCINWNKQTQFSECRRTVGSTFCMQTRACTEYKHLNTGIFMFQNVGTPVTAAVHAYKHQLTHIHFLKNSQLKMQSHIHAKDQSPFGMKEHHLKGWLCSANRELRVVWQGREMNLECCYS